MKIALLFPGYGSQFVGMGKDLYNEHRIVQEYFDEASSCLDINFIKLCFASSDLEVSSINNAYTSIFLLSSAIYALLKEAGIQPTVVAGFNLGEYSAFFAGGSISLPDGLYLLNKLASFYEEMLKDAEFEIVRVRGISTDIMKTICSRASVADSRVDIAAYLGEADNVFSGHKDAVARMRTLVFESDPEATFEMLPLEFGLHSESMDPVAQNFKMYLEKVDFKDLTIPLISGIDGQVLTQGNEIKEHVLKMLVCPMVWTRVLQMIGECDLIVEVGPSNTLESMVKNAYPDKLYQNVNKQSDIDKIKYMMVAAQPDTVNTDVEI
jgi:[acyl-carrier-protein] S-malonyltransferase